MFVYISNTERERNIPENIFPELISYQVLILYKKLTSNEMKMVRNAIVLDREVIEGNKSTNDLFKDL